MRLLKDEEIKFSADRFLVKWLFAKTNEHFRLVQARFAKTNEYFRLVQVRFVRHYEGYILREFQILRLNLNGFNFFFYWTNRSILMFHVSFCRYFEYLHFFYTEFFSYNQYLSFYKRKNVLFATIRFFFAHFLHKSRVSNICISFLMAFRDFHEEKCWFIIFVR